MKLPFIEYPFTLLTPAMIGGAEGKAAPAEMRVASIRGQVRWWHRKAGLVPNCNQVWGQTEPAVVASKVSLTLAPTTPPSHREVDILPHKQSGFRDSILPLHKQSLILRRLVGCQQGEWEAAQKAVKLWLLLGGLGLRVNRAAGSVWPVGDWVPTDEASLKTTLTQLGYTQPVSLADASILEHKNLATDVSHAKKLRHAASDTVSVPRYFGSIKPRTPSPLKMKVIRLGANHRLLLTGLSLAAMAAARTALGTSKPLGSAAWHTL
ncbi:MAG: hypothetical protein KA004_04850 [Verrucomicrobiales bacterium]|nr:hypothetical protein [Verrucomicrobiales bacterium]